MWVHEAPIIPLTPTPPSIRSTIHQRGHRLPGTVLSASDALARKADLVTSPGGMRGPHPEPDGAPPSRNSPPVGGTRQKARLQLGCQGPWTTAGGCREARVQGTPTSQPQFLHLSSGSTGPFLNSQGGWTLPEDPVHWSASCAGHRPRWAGARSQFGLHLGPGLAAALEGRGPRADKSPGFSKNANTYVDCHVKFPEF